MALPLIKRLAVFCGGRSGDSDAFRQAAIALGQSLVEANITLVYGGGNIGLMGILADSMLEQGGDVIGVMPQCLVDKEIAHEGLSDFYIVNDMHERKAMIHKLVHGYIAMPGGYGTLDELFEALSWRQVGLHHKPCGLLNIDHYYDHLLAFLEQAVDFKILHSDYLAMLQVSDNAPKLVSRLLTLLDDVETTL